MKRSLLTTHRLYVFYKNGEVISKGFHCKSDAWFYGNDYLKRIDVSEIRIVKTK